MVGYCVFCTYKNANLSILNQVNQRGRTHGKPAFIQRAGDTMVLCSTRTLAQLMAWVKYTADLYTEADGSVTISMDDMGLAVNAPTEEQAKKALCREIMEYAQEYYDCFEAYSQSPNRAGHLPLVLRACAAGTPEELEGLLTYRTGEN